MKNKTVLFVCPDFYPRNTGYANAFQNLIRAVAKYTDYYIDVLTDVQLGDAAELSIEKVNVYRVEKKSRLKGVRFLLNQFCFSREINRLDNEKKYEFIMMETFEYSLVPLFLNDNILNKFTARIHACYETERRFFYPGLLNYINRKIINYVCEYKVKHICSTNKYHIDFAKKHFLKGNLYKICQKNFYVVPNTIELECSDKSVKVNVGGVKEFLTLGRMDSTGRLQKGFSDLLSALYLAAEKIRGKINYTIIGKGVNLEVYKDFIAKHKLDFVTIVEYEAHSDLLLRMKVNDVVVLPSRYEGMSMFALEALATENAVIFSKTGGLVDMCEGASNGFFTEPQDISDLADKIIMLAEMSDSEISNMKTSSINLFKDKFTPQQVAKSFEQMVNITKAGI